MKRKPSHFLRLECEILRNIRMINEIKLPVGRGELKIQKSRETVSSVGCRYER